MMKISKFSFFCPAASAMGSTISFIRFSISESLIKPNELDEIDNKKNNNNTNFLIFYE